MANKTFDFTLKGHADVNDITKAISQVRQQVDKADLGASFSKQFSSIFKGLAESTAKLEDRLKRGISSPEAFKEALKYTNALNSQYATLQGRAQALAQQNDKELRAFIPKEILDRLKSADSLMKNFIKEGDKLAASTAKQQGEAKKLTEEIGELQNKIAKIQSSGAILDENKLKKTKQNLQDVGREIANLEGRMTTKRRNPSVREFVDAKEDYAKKNEGKGWSDKQLEANFKKTTAYKQGSQNADVQDYLADDQQLARLTAQQELYRKTLDASNQATKDLGKANKDLSETQEALNAINTKLQDSQNQSAEALGKFREKLAEILDVDIDKLPTSFEELQEYVNGLESDQIEKVRTALGELTTSVDEQRSAVDKLKTEVDEVNTAYKQWDEGMKASKEISNKITQFFTAANGIALLRRAIQNSFSTIKELDKIMTETAVVTDFKVSDMWDQLPEYTDRANQLGVAIRDTYKAATLFYQQGLKTNEVVGISNQTLKMARIAGLDAAEATNKMTAALRGFNMEITETNAERISDVYSKLASITASNVQEISSAMTKTASIASSAGMQFETTAAFLSQIIETTRESAETAGTALKTVIARFQELKKDPSEIGEVDGEIVDANKIETALRTVGVALRDSSGQFRELDQVFMELASKWDSLDLNTQRYIATIAAGSRQQSRFIAMMSDYKRTQELVSAANNSAGASAQQYEKTLDSLETKLNKLKNAWDEFTLSIANSQIIKGAVDLITNLITAFNKLTSILPGVAGSFTKLAISIGAFNAGSKIFKVFTTELKKDGVGAIDALAKTGKKTFADILTGVKKVFNKNTWTATPLEDTQKSLQKLEQVGMSMNGCFETSGGFIKDAAAAQAGLTTQAELYNDALALGIPEEQAKIALSMSDAEATAVQSKITDELTDSEYANLLSTELTNKSEQAGLLTKAKYTLAVLFGNKATRKEALAKLASIGVTWAKKASDIAATGSQWGLNASIMACPLGWFAAAIILVIALLAAFAIALYAASDAAKMKALNEQIEHMEEAITNVNEKMDTLAESKNKLESLHEELNKLTKGTTAWNKKLLETNGEVMNLISKYPTLAKYVQRLDTGELTIDSAGFEELETSMTRELSLLTNATIGLKQERDTLAYRMKQEEAMADVQNKTGLGKVRGHIATAAIGSVAGGIGGPTGVAGAAIGSLIDSKEVAKIASQADIGLAKFRDQWYGKLTSGLVAGLFGPMGHAAWAAEQLINFGITKITGRNATERAEARANGGLTNAELQAFMAKAGAEGITADDTEGLKKIFQSLGYSEKYWEGTLEHVKALGDSFNDLTIASRNLELQQRAERQSVMANIATNNEAIASSEYAILAQDSMVDAYEDYDKRVAEQAKGSGNSDNLNDEDYRQYAELTGKSFDEAKKEDPEVVKRTIAANKVQEDIEADMQKILNKMTQLTNGEYKNSAQVGLLSRLGGEGKNLLRADIDSFLGSAGISGEDFNLLTEEEKTKKINEWLASTGTSLEELGIDVKTFSDNIVFGARAFARASAAIPESLQDLLPKYISAGATEGFAKNIASVIAKGGEQAGKLLLEDYNNVLGSMTQENQEKLTSALNAIDWTDIDAWDTLIETLVGEGIDPTDQAIQNFIQHAKEASYASKKIDVEAIKTALASVGKMVKEIREGTRGAVFSDSEYQNIIKGNKSLAKDFQIDLEGNYVYVGSKMDDLAEALAQNTEALLQSNKEKLTEQIEAGDFLEEALKKDTEFFENLSGMEPEEFDKVFADMKKAGIDLDKLDIDNLSNKTKARYLTAETRADIIEGLIGVHANRFNNQDALEQLKGTTTTLSLQQQRITQNAANFRQTEDAEVRENKYGSILVQANAANIDLNKLQKYREAYNDLIKMTDKGSDSYKRLEKKVKELGTELANDASLKSANDRLKELFESAKEAADSYETLTEEQARLIAANQIASSFGMIVDSTNAQEFIELTRQMLNEGSEEAYLKIITMSAKQAGLAIGNGSKEALEEMLNTEAGKKFGEHLVQQGLAAFQTIEDKEVLHLRIEPELSDASVLSGAGNGAWENPYDWLYNMNRKINAQIRERDKLERQYTLSLEDSNRTTAERVGILKKELNVLATQRKMQEQKMTYAQEERGILQKNYSYFDKYIDWTPEGTFRVNYDKVNAAKFSEEVGASFEAYVGRLEELQDTEEEAADAINDIDDSVKDIKNTGRDEYIEFENRVLDALVDKYTKEIEELEEINNTIDTANQNLIDSMQKSIDRMRRDRDNAKTEQDLSDKQRRLAYLQMDTSGANALEILKLQDEITQGQEDYTDTLIDQMIQDMTDANTEAAEQRQQQIELMRKSLEQAKTNGELWPNVKKLMENSITDKGVVLSGSSLEKLLMDAEGVKALSAEQKAKWQEELNVLTATADTYIKGKLKGYEGTPTTTGNETIRTNISTIDSNILAIRNWLVGEEKKEDIDVAGEIYQKLVEKNATQSSDFNQLLKGEKLSNGVYMLDELNKGENAYMWNWLKSFLPVASLIDLDDLTAASLQDATNEFVDSAEQARLAKWKLMNRKEYVMATGGLADYTGPAWLDGTPTKPELVLNPTDTQNFIALKDILANLSSDGTSIGGDTYYDIDIDVDSLANDYDVEQLADKIKTMITTDATYRNVNAVNRLR